MSFFHSVEQTNYKLPLEGQEADRDGTTLYRAGRNRQRERSRKIRKTKSHDLCVATCSMILYIT